MAGITTAELFVAQTHLSLDDPDGPYTAGTPNETLDTLGERIRAATIVEAGGDRPEHVVIELDDNSAVTVIGHDGDHALRLACSGTLATTWDWAEDSGHWVIVSGQPEADEFKAGLYRLILSAPGPAQLIPACRAQPCDAWTDNMLRSARGQLGQLAAVAAQSTWSQMQQRRQSLDAR